MRFIRHPYTRLFISTLLISLASILMLAALTYFAVKQEAKVDVVNLTDSLLETTGTQFSFYLGQARNITYGIFEDEVVKSLVNNSFHDVFGLTYVIDDFTNIMISHDYIHSIYLGSPDKAMVAVVSRPEETEDYPELLSSIIHRAPLRPIPRTTGDGGEQKVLTLYYHGLGGYAGGDPEAYVIVNIDADWINAFISQSVSDKTLMVITDQDGTIIASADPGLFGKSIPITEPDNRGISDTLSALSGLSYPRSLVRTAEWKEGRLYGAYMGESSVLSVRGGDTVMVILTGGVILSILVTGVVIWLSRTLYKPISRVFSAGVNSLGSQGSEDNINTLAERIVIQMGDLAAAEQQLLTVNEHNFLNKLLNSSATFSEEVILQEFYSTSFIKPNMSFEMQIAVFRIDNCRRFIEENTFGSIREILAGMQMDCDLSLHSFCRTLATDMSDDHFVLLCALDGEKTPLKNGLIEKVPKLGRRFKETYGVGTTVGLSETFDSVLSLRKAYHLALRLTNYRLNLGPGHCLRHESVGEILSGARHNPEVKALIKKMTEYTQNNDGENFRKTTERFFTILKSYDYESILAATTEVMYTLMNLYSFRIDTGKTPQIRYIDLYDKLSLAESLEELSDAVISVHEKVIKDYQEVQAHISENNIKECLSYIKENMTDPMLSASRVAEKLEITPQYFSKIFHRATGKSFPQYLNDIRLEEAYTLLRQKRHAGIEAIFRAVGYNSRNHFTALFKTKFSVTPSQMRKSSLTLSNRDTIVDSGDKVDP